jgi:MutS domain V
MKVLLMDPTRPLDLEATPPANAEQLIQDLELETLLAAMAAGDEFLYRVARAAILGSVAITDPSAIIYRQRVLADTVAHRDVIDRIYAIAVEAIAGERKIWGFGHASPEILLSRSLQRLDLFMDKLKELLDVSDQHVDAFESDGFRRLFSMIGDQLPAKYFEAAAAQIAQLRKPALLVSAQLGAGNKAINYTLRSPWPESLRDRLSRFRNRGLSFQVADRDEAGARAIGELRARAINDAANAVAQSAEHILAFFRSLQTELAFYLAVGNLQRHLTKLGQPTCIPTPTTTGTPRLSARRLYDPCLALTLNGPVVGNELDGTGKSLVVITGANQGGKSTFLRAVGLAQLMLQAGMFVGAETFAADARDGIFTHYKREEDTDMNHGKLDEELDRMSAIAKWLRPGSLLLSNESFASTNEREGSEIAGQVLAALTESGVKVVFVTHLFDLAHRLAVKPREDVLFLRAQRADDGCRTFEVQPGEPLPTSYAEDTYAQVFGDTLY